MAEPLKRPEEATDVIEAGQAMSFRNQLLQQDPLSNAPAAIEQHPHAMPLGDETDRNLEKAREQQEELNEQLKRRSLPGPVEAPEPDFEMRGKYHFQPNRIADARQGQMDAASLEGYSREEIHDQFAKQRQAARDAGYSDNEIDKHVGFTWPDSGVARGQFGRLALDPEKVLDIGRAVWSIGKTWYSAVDRLMSRGITDPENLSHSELSDVLTAGSILTPGAARVSAGIGEIDLGALGGRTSRELWLEAQRAKVRQSDLHAPTADAVNAFNRSREVNRGNVAKIADDLKMPDEAIEKRLTNPQWAPLKEAETPKPNLRAQEMVQRQQVRRAIDQMRDAGIGDDAIRTTLEKEFGKDLAGEAFTDPRHLRLLAGGGIPPEQREEAHKAGYTDEEIDAHFGLTPPAIPRPLLDRLLLGGRVETATDRIFAAAGEGFATGYGDVGYGLEPGGDTEQRLQRMGLLASPDNPAQPLFMSKVIGQAMAAPEKTYHLLGALFSGATSAAGHAIGQLEQELGREKTQADYDKDEITNFLNYTALAKGHHDPMRAPIHNQMQGVVAREIQKVVQSNRDIVDAAKEVTGGVERDSRVEAKLGFLYSKYGLTPQEVAADAAEDPAVKASLVSRGTDLPEKYVGAEEQPKPMERPMGVPADAYQGADGRWYQSWPRGTEFESVYSANGRFVRNTGGHERDRISEGMEKIRQGIEAAGAKTGEPEQTLGAPDAETEAAGSRRLGAMTTRREGGGGVGEPPEPPIEGGALGEEGPRRIEGPAPAALKVDELANARDEIARKISWAGPPGEKWTYDKLYTWFVDRLYPISQAVNRMREEGYGLETFQDPYRLARMYAGVQGKVRLFLGEPDAWYDKLPYKPKGWYGSDDEGTRDFSTFRKNGKSLKQILEPVKDDMRNFTIFATSARAMELANRGIESGMPLEAARRVVANREALHASVLQDLYEYQDRVAGYYRDSGMLSEAAYKAMTEANRYFVPFHRIFEEEGLGISRAGTLQASQIIRRIEGSQRDIVNPLESIIKNTHMLIQMSERNMVGRALIESMLDFQGLRKPTPLRPGKEPLRPIAGEIPQDFREGLPKPTGTEIEPVDAPVKKASGPIAKWIGSFGVRADVRDLSELIADASTQLPPGHIAIWRDGLRETFRVDPELSTAFKNLDAPTIGILERFLALPSASLRAGAVLNLAFFARHVMRDYIYALGTFREGFFTPVDMARGLLGQIKVAPDWHDFMMGGGLGTSLMSMDRRYLHENLEGLTQQTGLMTRAYNVVIDPDSGFFTKSGRVLGLGGTAVDRYILHPLRAMFEIAANASHYGAYLRMRGQQRGAPRLALPAPAKPAPSAPGEPAGPALPSPYGGEPALPHPPGTDLRIRPGVDVDTALRDHVRSARPPGEEIGEVSPIAEKNKRDILHATWVARDTAVDAARMGSVMRAVNLISAFSNIKMQDTDRVARAFINAPMGSTLKFGLGIAMPSLLTWWHGHTDSRYRDANDWEKHLFWLVPLDSWEDATPAQAANRKPDMIRVTYRAGQPQLQLNNGAMLRFPKPFAAGVIFGSAFEQALDSFFENNPDAYKHLGHSMMEQTVGDLLPNGLVPFIEKAQNRSVLTGHTLIPDNLEKGMPEYQSMPYTSELGKALGQLVASFPGMKSTTESLPYGSMTHGALSMLQSPIHIENMIRGWTGELGNEAFRLADWGLRKAGVLPDPAYPERQLSDIPFIKAFTVRYPTASPQVLQDFYNAESKAQEHFTSWKSQAAQGNTDAMKRIEEIGGEGMFAQFKGIHQAIHNLNTIVQMTYQNPSIKPYEKRQLIDGLYWQMQTLAEQGMASVQYFEKRLKP
jgi:Large polyvalent protein associated domain 38